MDYYHQAEPPFPQPYQASLPSTQLSPVNNPEQEVNSGLKTHESTQSAPFDFRGLGLTLLSSKLSVLSPAGSLDTGSDSLIEFHHSSSSSLTKFLVTPKLAFVLTPNNKQSQSLTLL